MSQSLIHQWVSCYDTSKCLLHQVNIFPSVFYLDGHTFTRAIGSYTQLLGLFNSLKLLGPVEIVCLKKSEYDGKVEVNT